MCDPRRTVPDMPSACTSARCQLVEQLLAGLVWSLNGERMTFPIERLRAFPRFELEMDHPQAPWGPGSLVLHVRAETSFPDPTGFLGSVAPRRFTPAPENEEATP